ncbi:DUF1329 domain-containing protein [Pseudomonas sp. CAN2814]|uniref:DUF1329 domain-containing protein n=1 Tax=Pseudomonas sp. CAN1 TaxID=3046726 RepID=UPI0026488140|nr:DUF1329 domain-containing protein [Pseudomonas sp. CAN1]MDN6860772.1 DUF1329 domain-containing protein [Pseudomonas sp. CAN1]
MNRSTYLPALLLSAGFACLSGPALAKVSAEEAARLGQDLTPMGAEKAGNADGSIPAWTGKWRGAPPQVKYDGPGSRYADPYAEEKPLFVITAQNMEQYSKQLTDGQRALFKRYPATFKMPIYPTHRDFRFSEKIEANIKANATSAELVDGGNAVRNAFGASPFPIPRDGYELMWNHALQARANSEEAIYDQAVIYSNGNQALQTVHYQILAPWCSPAGSLQNYDGGVMSHFMITTLKPVRSKGEIIGGNEFFDPVASPRQSWQYLPGTRRVRRAPTVGYDTPTGAGGFRTIDEDRLFNGAPDRYEWKLIGKREIYIPYNNYKLDDPALKYSQILTPNHVNPDYMRYELHRVWVVEATLKPGARHIYAKRTLYLDEDSWSAALADNYDARGQLWRTNMQTTVYAYDIQVNQARVALYHDLIAGSYLADRMANEQAAPKLNSADYDANYFTAANMRKLGQ